ncbi:hypothetical protein XaclCFBP3371_19530 [Xanthomonas euvesicatoria pv. citrumelonis]|nr:hypothetical protein Xcom_03655 [Xanthomonas axonopodis pv. commiphoreae]OQP37899.1 hypothetical protein IB62_014470 [Xanthomonas euvesicatoria]PPU86885.1 hypothetical protein XaclCFBP3371_19530 [Xanthomonas euvesicatoria pv. citrumelonis]
MSARHGTAHPNAADVNKTGATLADRSRVSILLLVQVKLVAERRRDSVPAHCLPYFLKPALC